jgi:biotin carboxyl carrier protein
MILTADEITELAAHMRNAGVAEIEIAEGGDALRIAVPEETTRPAAVAAPEPTIVKAAACGVFLPGHPARTDALPAGTGVVAGEVVAVIAIGALLQPVVAPRAGTVLRLFAVPGQRVDFGTELLALAPLPSLQSKRQRKDV